MLIASTLVAIAGSALGQLTDDVAAARAELRADAAGRTSLLEGERGLLQGDPSVRVGGLLQFRYTANVRDTPDGSSEESFTHGFSFPRARLTVDADLNETWSVFLQGNFQPDGGTFTLLDAWADWQLDDSWTIRGGQFKVPSTREWQIGEPNGLAADRSVVNQVYSAGRTQGVAAIWAQDEYVFIGSFNSGANALNSDFNGASNADYAFTGRFDWQFAGERSQMDTLQGWQGEEFAGLLGGFAHYQDGGNTGVGNTGTTADFSLFEALIDCQVEGNGWNAYGAGIYQMVDAAGSDSLNHFGAILQGGYMVAEADELFARYDVVIPDSDTPGGSTAFNTIALGWNHFFIPESNASRFTLDVQWFLNATADNGLVGPNTQFTGLLESSEKDQVALRAQYQAVF